MAISVDWSTKIVSVPQADLDLIGGTLYELDTDALRLQLKSIEASVEGMAFPDTHRHNTEVTVAGTTFARTIEIVNGYSIEFEDGAYTVRLSGSNNNVFDVESGILEQNQVQVIAQNSAGLIVTTGMTPSQVWDENIEVDGMDALTARETMRLVLAALAGKISGAETTTITIRDALDHVDRIIATVDNDGNRTAITLDPSD